MDAMKSSVVGEKGDDHTEKDYKNEDNINGAGKGGVFDEGGNGLNENANLQNYQGDGDGGNKYQKDEDTEKTGSTDGNNGNSDENDGGCEEVGAEDGEKEKTRRPFVANLIQPSPTSPTLINVIRRLPKKSSVYDVTKREQIQKGKEEEVHF
jgi:hypothetical protein